MDEQSGCGIKLATVVVDSSDLLSNLRVDARDYSDELWTHHITPFKGLTYKSLSFFNKDPAR